MTKETDRGCGVLGAALLDSKLELLFQRKLRTFHDKLLGKMGPLGTFSARIRAARALVWIGEDVRADLDTVRDIRNEFAHSWDHALEFTDQAIADRCRNLRTATAFVEGHVTPPGGLMLSTSMLNTLRQKFSEPRVRYEVAVGFLAQHLDEIPGETAEYSGPDVLAEIRKLSSETLCSADGSGIPLFVAKSAISGD